jgi:serine O-acetyltransferase
MYIPCFIKKIYKKLYQTINYYSNRINTPQYMWVLREKLAKNQNSFMRHYYLNELKRIEIRFNCSIPVSARIENMPAFPHGLNGIFISLGANIGKDCIIFHQVTIGSNTLADSNVGAPTIGDNVFIGVGAKIIGNVVVGNNVRIGANCVIVRDVPDNSTVVLPPVRVITHTEKRNNTFVAYSLDNDVNK